MKKILLSAALIAAFSLSAQVLESDNFNALTLGNLTTDPTGATAGQGGFRTSLGTGGVASEAQIVSYDAAHGNSLQMTGSSGITPNKYVWKNGISTTWPTRTPGNDILKLTVSIYTGSPATGVARGGAAIFNTGFTKYITGIGYDYTSQKIVGYANYTINGNTGNYVFTLGANTYPANTWVNVSTTFNLATGAVNWTTPEGTYSPSTTAVPAAANVAPNELNFMATVGSTTATPPVPNAVAHITGFDDYTVLATNAASLATQEAPVLESAPVILYPNPASDILMIKAADKIQSAEVFDMAGRKLNTNLRNNTIDVRGLQSGTYLINVVTEAGNSSQKFIKK